MVAEPRLGCLVGGGREYPAGGVFACWWVLGSRVRGGFSRVFEAARFRGFRACL